MTQAIRLGRPPGNRDTKEQCLVAAEKVFADHGFSACSLNSVAKAVGVSNAAIVHHFQSKKNLYSTVLDRISESLHQSFPGLSDDDYGVEGIADLFEYFLDWSLQNMDYSMILLRELMENRNRVLNVRKFHMNQIISSYSSNIEKGKKSGLFLHVDSKMFVFFMLGSITHFAVANPTISRMLDSGSDQETLARFRETMRHTVINMLNS